MGPGAPSVRRIEEMTIAHGGSSHRAVLLGTSAKAGVHGEPSTAIHGWHLLIYQNVAEWNCNAQSSLVCLIESVP